jgi:hypothetical protein
MSQKNQPEPEDPAAAQPKRDDRSCRALSHYGAVSKSPRVLEKIDRRRTDLAEPVVELLSGIEGAFQSKKNLEPAQRQRERFVAAIAALVRFLLRVDSKHANDILVLGDAIADLNLGARHPLLVPIKKRARPFPLQIQRARGEVVFALEVLITLGASPHDAAKKILKDFPGIENLARKSCKRNSKSALINAILEWRKTLSAPSRHKGDEPAGLYKTGREMINSTLDMHEEESARRHLLEAADECLRDAEKVAVLVGYLSTP